MTVPLEGILPMRVPTTWKYEGPMTFVSKTWSAQGTASSYVVLAKGEAFGRLVVSGHKVMALRGLTGKLRMPTATAGRVHCRYAGSGPHETFYDLDIVELASGKIPRKPTTVRETILGMTVGPRTVPGMATHFPTKAFGRDMIIAGYPSEDPVAPVDSTQIVYAGVPFSVTERWAIIDLLRFLTAQRGGSWFIEAFDVEKAQTGFRYRNNGALSLERVIKPVDFHPITGKNNITHLVIDFPVMTQKLQELTGRDPIAEAATLHHYNESTNTSYPISQLRNFSVALEALVGLIVGRQTKTQLTIPKPAFKRAIKPVLQAFDKSFRIGKITAHGAFHGNLPQKVQRIRGKVQNANNESPRQEMFQILSGVGLRLRPIERRTILDYRNGVLHTGYHGDETERKVLLRNHQAASLIANVFNRAMLMLLGFRGKYLDAYSGNASHELGKTPTYRLLAQR